LDKINLIKRLLERGRRGEFPMGVVAGCDSAEMVELAGAGGMEWIIIDQEHTLIEGPKEALPLLRAAELFDMVTVVKLNGWDPIKARDAFDAGACGIQIPFVESVDQLREMIAACRFRPVGTRGYCPASRATKYDFSPEGYERYLELVNEHILIIPTIESEEGVNNLDEMLAAFPECPIFAIGPEDLRMSLGVSFDKEGSTYMHQVYSALSKKIRAAGKLNMIPMWGPAPGSDSGYVAEAVEALHNDLPYVLDGACLLYGYKEAMNIRERVKTRARETSK
jgi:2-keto-3-deoxy-L-rhamnonate aldolase RhmA